jgi:hypothetical protein
MRKLIRLGVVVGVALGSSPMWSNARADEEPSAMNRTTDQEVPTVPPEPSRDVFEPGAASAEPEQAIEESPGTKDHETWVQSIWSSP